MKDDRAVSSLLADIERSAAGARRLRLRTLLAKFGYAKRSDGNTAEITRLLNEAGVALNPPIVRLGESWEITPDDWIHLSTRDSTKLASKSAVPTPPLESKADAWFKRIAGMELRTEKEVEIKFIVPLLARLGYTDDDRYDGMPVPAAHGSRDTTLVIDFALFNAECDPLHNQPLLTVEAKRESRLSRPRELASAHNQAKSYCLWTQCDFFMVTDGRTILAYRVGRGRFGDLSPLFGCDRDELAERFADLYAAVSREALTRHYLAKFATAEEDQG